MAKWLDRAEVIVPVCITFGPAMLYLFPTSQVGLWLLIVGLTWLYLAAHSQRQRIRDLTALLSDLHASGAANEPTV